MIKAGDVKFKREKKKKLIKMETRVRKNIKLFN